jgi:hypothetical protein
LRKRQFFRRKLAKIADNCDHNIDPWKPSTSEYVLVGERRRWCYDTGDWNWAEKGEAICIRKYNFYPISGGFYLISGGFYLIFRGFYIPDFRWVLPDFPRGLPDFGRVQLDFRGFYLISGGYYLISGGGAQCYDRFFGFGDLF